MCDKRKKNKKKLSHYSKSHISGTREAISLKFGMWSAEVGGHVHSKNCLVSSRKHRATEVRNCVFFLSVNILTGVTRRLLGPHDTLSCVLIIITEQSSLLVCSDLPKYMQHNYNNDYVRF